MARIKILLLTARADHGGGPRHVDLLLNNLSAAYNLYVACPADKPYYDFWKSNSAVEDIFLLPHRKFSAGRLLNLSQYIKTNGITIVHSHGKGAGVYSRMLKFFNTDLKVVHTFHGVHTQEYGTISRNLYYLYERLMKPLTNRFINVSYGEREICKKNGFLAEHKQETIYNGVPDLAQNLTAGNSTGTFKVISISRFDFSKHMQLAYQVAKLLRHEQDIEFVWVGDGADKNNLAIQATADGLTNITFTGFTDHPEKYLKDARLYLSTSRWEGLPLSLIEAASLGIPLVATDVTGNNEVVQHNLNGYLYKAEEPEEAANFILKLAKDEKLYRQLSGNARITYLSSFTVAEMARQTEKVYYDLSET